MRRFLCCTLLVWLVLGADQSAAAAGRVALVIGNAAYQNTEPLANPVNDAEAVAAALRRLDFAVIEATNEDKAGMQARMREFADALQDAKVSLFFYAGHGLQVQGRNYLVPVDATLQSEVDLSFEAVAVDVVLDLMEQVTPQRLVFLDACRDNPLAQRLARSAGQSRSLGVGRGLARMNSGVGTLIAFATEPGKIALDGEDGHSPFTRALLEHIDTRGLEIRQMLSRVRATVIERTDGQQLPLDTSALIDDFYFAPADDAPEAAPAAPGVADSEQLFWQSIRTSADVADFEAYLERYPDGAFVPLARNRIKSLRASPETEVAAVRQQTSDAALLEAIGERDDSTGFRFDYRIAGRPGTEFVSFRRWQDAGSTGDGPRLEVGDGGVSRVLTASDSFGEAVQVNQAGPEMFGVLLYSRIVHGGGPRLMHDSVSSALKQWRFLEEHGGRIRDTSKVTYDGVQFGVARLDLKDDAPARDCLGFVGVQRTRRVDGFVCGRPGAAVDLTQVDAMLSRIHVPGFVEP